MITKSFLFIREYIFSYIIPLINGVGFIEKGFNQILNNLTMFHKSTKCRFLIVGKARKPTNKSLKF